MWTEVYKKLNTEHRVTPIYSPQCNGRIEGFHRFLKACIAKQLENRVEWDDLFWKATAAYNFFPTKSSGIAPFFQMFGYEANVKHTLLASESPRYMGTDESIINVELMTKLYLVVAHNLNEARKARDKNIPRTVGRETEILKVGDNVLVRDHTSKVFQPKYKDFCIIGFVGKNQVEVKDNHGHTTKVHRRDVKKIPMTEKLSQICEEEQIGKTRNGRKGVPDSKMPTLNWTLENQKATPGEETIEEIETHRHLSKIQGTIICIMLFIYSFLSIIRQLVRRTAKTTREIATQLANTFRDIRHSMRATSHNFWKQCENCTPKTGNRINWSNKLQELKETWAYPTK